MPDNIPETGNVVIHSSGSHATPSFAIRAVAGPDQFGCATRTVRTVAERMAGSCAKRSGVNLCSERSFPRSSTSTAPANALNRWCDPRRKPTRTGNLMSERICLEAAQKAPRR